MLDKTRIMAMAGMVAALTVGYHSEARAACSLIVPPIKINVCQQADEELPGYGLLSCERPRNHDQVTFCAAVYGYERHWCARIGSSVLRQACWDRTE